MAYGKSTCKHSLSYGSMLPLVPSLMNFFGQHILVASWDDSVTPSGVEAIKERMTKQWVPTLASATGESDSGSYMNEADVREPNFQTTFFGTNYGRLKSVKAVYDPTDLFIVGAGVGSENWDADGICRI